MKVDQMKTIGVKFCGGCNPSYDRAEFWEKIKAAADGKLCWADPDQPDIDALLIICGCHTACPEKNFRSSDYSLFLVINDIKTSSDEVMEKILKWRDI